MPHVQKRKMKNEIQIRFSKRMWELKMNERKIRFSKWRENEKQKMKVKSSFQSKAKNRIPKPKFESPFQSAAKTKNEKRNSNPFFNVTSRQKTKNRNGNGIPFYKAKEKRKIKWNLNSIFLCHRKTVSTKVHTVAKLSDSVCSQTTFGSSTSISQCC